MSKLSKLKKGLKSQVASMVDESKDSKKGGEDSFYDVNFYKPKAGKNHSVNVEIRFIPTISDDGSVKLFQEEWKHFLNINNVREVFPCLTVNGQNQCPICNANKEIYSEANYPRMKKEGRFRTKKWVANILIVDDPEEPENNGKIMLYKVGTKLFNRITEELKEEESLLDPEEGYNFKLKIENADNFDISKNIWPNYETSGFVRKPSAIGETEDEILEILDRCISMDKIAEEYNVEAAVIEKKFDDFLLRAEGKTVKNNDSEDEEPKEESIVDKARKEKKSKKKEEAKVEVEDIPETTEETTEETEEEEDLDEFLNNLTEDDE